MGSSCWKIVKTMVLEMGLQSPHPSTSEREHGWLSSTKHWKKMSFKRRLSALPHNSHNDPPRVNVKPCQLAPPNRLCCSARSSHAKCKQAVPDEWNGSCLAWKASNRRTTRVSNICFYVVPRFSRLFLPQTSHPKTGWTKKWWIMNHMIADPTLPWFASNGPNSGTQNSCNAYTWSLGMKKPCKYTDSLQSIHNFNLIKQGYMLDIMYLILLSRTHVIYAKQIMESVHVKSHQK